MTSLINTEFFSVSDYFSSAEVKRDGFFSQLDEADTTNPASLVYCQNLHYLSLANNNANVSAVITTPLLANEPVSESKAVIVATDPRLAFFSLYAEFYSKERNRPKMEFGVGRECRIHTSAVVSPRSWIGDRVEIGAHAVIEDFVQIMSDVYIGPNAVIGAEGLITLRREGGGLLTIKHSGGVEIGVGSQILAGAVVAKSLFCSPTKIGKFCQIGIMANVGHGVSINDESVVSGNTVIAGRTKLGRRVWVGTSVSIAQGLVVGDEAQIKMGAVVINNVADKGVVSGNFAVSHKANMRHFFKIEHYEKV